MYGTCHSARPARKPIHYRHQRHGSNLLPRVHTPLTTADWCIALLDAIATHEVGNRPNRFEPRVRKRRPKKYKLLREPRENYRRLMAT